ncbi:unnamed protein product, partial [Choristocarpus tenellus]
MLTILCEKKSTFLNSFEIFQTRKISTLASHLSTVSLEIWLNSKYETWWLKLKNGQNLGTSRILWLSVISQFRDGMWACILIYGSEYMNWFEVSQGLQQGCVLVPIPFNHLLHGGAKCSAAVKEFNSDL